MKLRPYSLNFYLKVSILFCISCGENKASNISEISKLLVSETKKDSVKKDTIIKTEKPQFDYYPDTTPFPVNPWLTKVGWEINDTDAMAVLKNIFPAYWYYAEEDKYLGFWECENCKPVTYNESNYTGEYSKDTFPRSGDFYWTKLLGTSSFNWKGKLHWLLAFNTANDPMGAGRFIGGKLGMAIFSYAGLHKWKLENYNPIVGGYGSWQQSPMPQLRMFNDTIIYFSIETSSCGAGGPCFDDVYLFFPTKTGFSNHYNIKNFGYRPQSPFPPYWSSTINYGSNINIVTEGEFDEKEKENFINVKILSTEYTKRKNKPFNFTWNRTYQFKKNTWELVYEKLNVN